jgi:hypothetical protein
MRELHRSNRCLALKQSLGNPVHAVHDSTLHVEKYRVRRVSVSHEFHVSNEESNRWRTAVRSEPVRRVEVA